MNPGKRQMKNIAIVAGLGVLLVGGHFVGRALRPQDGARPDDRSAVAARKAVPLGGDARGTEDALVNIVEFSDFECPFCNLAQTTLKKLQQEYGSQIRVFFRHAPMASNQQAALASQAALAAGAQGRFWEMHDKLFANRTALGRADIERYAQQLALDMTLFRQALDNETHQARVAEDTALARRLGIRGLPAFFINGRLIVGAKPYDQFRNLVEDELARARRLAAVGTVRAQIYQKLMAGAQPIGATAERISDGRP
jgi:protein-disulfide isomerase